MKRKEAIEATRPLRTRRASRGMTVVEILVVVVIVGILALIGVIGYRKFISSGKLSEATNMVAKIREAQERRKAETGTYLDVSLGLGAGNYYPAATPGQFSTQWGGVCSTCKSAWSNLNISADEPVRFGYAVVADGVACDPTCKGVSVSIRGTPIDFVGIAGGKITGPYYIIEAQGQMAAGAAFSTVVGQSFTNELAIDEAGQ